MAIKRIKKDYHSKEEIPVNIKKDFDSASVHLSACWMLMSIVMQHLDEAQDAVKRYGAHKFEVKQNFDAINHHFDKLNDWYRKLAMKSAQGMELFNKEYPEITAQINKLLGFDECGFTYQEENNNEKSKSNE